jgi:catalase
MQVTAQDMVEALYVAFGDNHSRAIYAKGILLEGRFVPDPGARKLTSATLFVHDNATVLARFSNFTGIPTLPDTAADANPRGLALKFHTPYAAELDVVAHSFDGFPTRTSTEFRQLLLAIGLSRAGTAAPTALDRFLAAHPAAKSFFAAARPLPVSYATLGYFGVNAFRFTNPHGEPCYVRYRFVPRAGEQYLDAASASVEGPDYLAEELRQRSAREPILLDWIAQIAEPGDTLDDPSVSWPQTRRLQRLGLIMLTQLAPDQVGQDRKTLFLPANLPDGIAAADPMLAMRSATHPLSYRHRQ